MKTKMLLMIAALVAAPMAWAVNGFTYQGTLLNEAGTAPLTGSRTIQFRLYNVAEGGTALWAKTVSVLLDGQGTFSTEISDDVGTQIGSIPHNGLAGVIKANDNLFIGLTVNNTSGEIAPRQKVLPVPSAMIADDVRNASGNFTVAGQARANSIKAATRIESTTMQVTGTVTARELVASETVTAKSFVGNGTIPVGGIIMWSGTTVPNGWALCNGATVNGVRTPNLTERFVIGCNPNKAGCHIGDIGGSASIKLTFAQIPKHRHRTPYKNQYQTKSEGGSGNWQFWWANYGGQDDANKKPPTDTGEAVLENGKEQVEEHNNMPPYYCLAFIMRVK